ncbi:hypothetical protein LVB87_04955 [Lysobacter sp. KIS68-7]|uniref:hypothetical protein n=1 Tax=Lysobacter sp. KIS68-7 TaxID=2904252 RepID=UPI001E59EC62|nr:hypothetical protein [Lysobacter sp. KIS68-7]UHQ20510.1 hypothetical protein LVB87_04955 [Lysobacter sp. KIS68-7]
MFVLLGLFVAGFAFARQPETANLQVRGDLYLTADGTVERVVFDDATAPALKSLIETTVQRWRFAPVLREGVATRLRTAMTLDLEGVQVDGGFKMRVKRVAFANARTKYARLALPMIPISLDVVAALRVDAQGNVVDAAVVYLNGQLGGGTTERDVRNTLVRILKKSKLRPAELAYGEPADETFFMPIDFRTSPTRSRGDPRERFRHLSPVPWLDAAHPPDVAIDAMTPGDPIALQRDQVTLQSDIVGKML